jgi:hypothetical protein
VGEQPDAKGVTALLVLIHIEVGSRDSVQAFRPRMFEYYVQLRRDIASKGINNGQHIGFVLSGAGNAAKNGQAEAESATAEVGMA